MSLKSSQAQDLPDSVNLEYQVGLVGLEDPVLSLELQSTISLEKGVVHKCVILYSRMPCYADANYILYGMWGPP